MRSLLRVIILSVLLCHAHCGNILGVFDIPAKSIHILGHTFLAGLAKRGFNVTMISTFPVKEKIANYTHIYIEESEPIKEKCLEAMLRGDTGFGMLNVIKCQQKVLRIATESRAFQNFLKTDSRFDLIIQLYVMNEAFLGLAHNFDAPVIGYIPLSGFPHINDLTGNPSPPSYVPVSISPFTQDMTFKERTINTLMTLVIKLVHRFYILPNQRELLAKHFPEAPPLEDLQEKVDIVFVNSHLSTESPRPYVPNIIQIGGYHMQEPEPLTPELQKLMDGAKEGIIFFSFGSNVHTSELPKEKLDAFKNKFEKLNLKVLWSYGADDYSDRPKNVVTAKWYPQRGILAHPNVKAFITHGGMGGTIEALYFAVPILCINFWGDQYKNCHEAASYGYGVHLPLADVTKSSFSDALDEVLNNPNYSRTAKFRSELFREQPIKPMDKAVFWINHVLKYKGAKHLKTKARMMPLYQYLLLDVIGFLGTVLAVVLAVFYFTTRWILRKIFSRRQAEKIKKT